MTTINGSTLSERFEPAPTDTSRASVLRSIDPAWGCEVARYQVHEWPHLDRLLDRAGRSQLSWATTTMAERSKLLNVLADLLRERTDDLAALMMVEMGKPVAAGRAEVDKCAWVCEYYAEHGADFLADCGRESNQREAWTAYRPLGLVLAIMPWNFPLWQVIRCAAPTIMAGNAVVLKHASNVSGCALAIADLFCAAGYDDGLLTPVLLPGARIHELVADPRLAAVSLTGSTAAGRSVAEVCGRHLKPSLLELGGSDPAVILADADLDLAATACAASRLNNSGQSCVAAKRFIVVDEVHDDFVDRFVSTLSSAVVGDPALESTDVGPLARVDLRDELHAQVARSIDRGAVAACGGERPAGVGAFYPVTALIDVEPGMPAFDEELFGPVAAIARAADEAEAIDLANRSPYGLGASVYTEDVERGRRLAADELQAGVCFVNAAPASEPRLPFGGIRASGYGRELAEDGIRAFTNLKTLAIGWGR